jgi:Fur family transcriptional regulator, peroxide stress response regulator
MKSEKDLREKITATGLKVTPQRMVVLGALYEMNNHPSADQVLEYIQRTQPHMGAGTVYNILEVFSQKGIIKRVKTGNGIQKFDAVSEKHHHIYCTDTEKIEDFYDAELSQILEEYFAKRGIQGFEIEELNLHIIGKYNTKQKN